MLPVNKAAAADPAATAELPPPPTPMKIPLGMIHHVDAEGGFVLIRSSRHLQVEPGTVISVIDDAGAIAASVQVSPARKGQFLTADIVSGTPRGGQQTLMEHVRAAPGSPAPIPGSAGGDEIQVLE